MTNTKSLTRLTITALTIFTASISTANAAYDLPYIGDQVEYKTHYEDTFVHLARDYNLGFTEMRAANPYVDPWIPGAGTKIILPMRHLFPDTERVGIVINLAEMRLFGFMDENQPITFPIGVGREGLDTPLGKTKVVRKKDGPTWRPTARMKKEDPELKNFYPPGPDNPLGTHALYLGWPTYAIHGTNRPFGIGRRVSSGCIRMYPETISKLFELVPVGTPVQIVNQPIKIAWIDNNLYLEAHPTLEQSIDFEEKGVSEEQKLTDKEMKYLIEMAGEHQDRLNWPEIRTALKERKGYPIKIARRPAIMPEEIANNEAQKSEKSIKAKDSDTQNSENTNNAPLDLETVTKKLSAEDKVETAAPKTKIASDTHRAIQHSLNN